MRTSIVARAVLAGVSIIVFATSVPARTTAKPAASELTNMLGYWDCTERDTTGHTSRFRSNNTRYGTWLRLNAAFAAEPGQKPLTAVTFIGFDSGNKRWIISSTQSSGDYFVRASVSKHLSGSWWVDAYPADGATAVLTISPPDQWTFALSQVSGVKVFRVNVLCRRITRLT
jgi:hypothetical protein